MWQKSKIKIKKQGVVGCIFASLCTSLSAVLSFFFLLTQNDPNTEILGMQITILLLVLCFSLLLLTPVLFLENNKMANDKTRSHPPEQLQHIPTLRRSHYLQFLTPGEQEDPTGQVAISLYLSATTVYT